MATLEDEIKDLKDKNNELAQKVQYWKMTAAQRDEEKLDLMKENNELRLKLSRIRNNGGILASKLDAALQEASEKAISHLVKASAEIANSMGIAKAYMKERQEIDTQSPRWSAIGGSPTNGKNNRVHRVPPMMIGGQSIQPVVALSRTMLNTSNTRSTTRSPNQNRSLTERAVPMHMLQDVYIPLTRIDISDLPNNNTEMDLDTDVDVNNADDSPEEFTDEFVQNRLRGNADNMDDSDGHISEAEEYDASKLETVSEEETSINPIDPASPSLRNLTSQDKKSSASPLNRQSAPQRDSVWENPLEGPSWLLDEAPMSSNTPTNTQAPKSNLEPDSTTEVDRTSNISSIKIEQNTATESSPACVLAFSPTVRRRKRTSSPPPTPRHDRYSPRPSSCRRNSTSGRVLKVLVAKMRLDGPEAGGSPASPPKRVRSPSLSLGSFDAPSPNGATDSRVIVSETRVDNEKITAEPGGHMSRRDSHETPRPRVNGQDTGEDGIRLSRDLETVRGTRVQGTTSEHDLRSISQEHHDSVQVKHVRHGRMTSQETRDSGQSVSRQRSRLDSRDSRDTHDTRDTRDTRDSDSGSGGAGDSVCEGRTRRARKAVTYKEKPLNRKMRR